MSPEAVINVVNALIAFVIGLAVGYHLGGGNVDE